MIVVDIGRMYESLIAYCSSVGSIEPYDFQLKIRSPFRTVVLRLQQCPGAQMFGKTLQRPGAIKHQ
uniref:Uncharacterized protein n=1 Tax=Anguilla anguilla TaxID=7936 RepID=A0A0E9TWR0_ANGAN